jgi:hypothetical protein
MADTPQKHQHHQHHHHTDVEKEKRRKKALRRMGKIITKAWELPDAEPFQSYHGKTGGSSSSSSSSSTAVILCLTTLGQKVDEEQYTYGKHGWEDFARDIGGIYKRHQQRYVLGGKVKQQRCDRFTIFV